MVEQILVPMDDSPQATAALEYALAEFPEASITAIHVIELPEGYWAAFVKSEDDFPGHEQAHNRANDLLEETVERASDADRDIETVVETGKPAHEIVEHAVENDVDQIVIGSHGRKRAGRLLFGSVSESVVRTAPMTVVVVHDA
ncbi:universal stress protein [Halostagnicola kamekurae]|uniref:Nucleotide-binding universal stress protein, UspA family n=1 Tax=Halostagnicola kamekurae TaxID=619731 RepID=A0A1I6RJX3_9EURY|nr:universal stress protein [Halostagnicola kamekurae]SFS64778.1 Nucleotide-binding universal stress protein, UspA family [Halostagnicola kamekurae]